MTEINLWYTYITRFKQYVQYCFSNKNQHIGDPIVLTQFPWCTFTFILINLDFLHIQSTWSRKSALYYQSYDSISVENVLTKICFTCAWPTLTMSFRRLRQDTKQAYLLWGIFVHVVYCIFRTYLNLLSWCCALCIRVCVCRACVH